ncbi:MAG: hypothetical protein H7Y41_06210 [Hyphomonadaceae bacterium]|nr:hypothetical protein [Clostridia bacterium]
MSSAYLAIEQYFMNEGFNNIAKTDDSLVLNVGASNGSFRIIVYVRDTYFTAYAISPVKIPPQKNQDIAEFLHRANCGLNIGNFEMNYAGDVRFKSNHFFGDDTPSLKVIERVFDMSYLMLNKYFPGINAVVYGNETPENAIAAIEATE